MVKSLSSLELEKRKLTHLAVLDYFGADTRHSHMQEIANAIVNNRIHLLESFDKIDAACIKNNLTDPTYRIALGASSKFLMAK